MALPGITTPAPKTLAAPAEIVAGDDKAFMITAPVEGEVMFTCHPIQKLMVGPYEFQKGTLKLRESEVADFEALVQTVGASTRATIQKIDVAAAERLVASMTRPVATKVTDSSTGERANKAVGTGELGDGNLANGGGFPTGDGTLTTGDAGQGTDQNTSLKLPEEKRADAAAGKI